MVISNPKLEAPSLAKSRRQQYWDWINPLLESRQALSVYARVGRGGVAIFDVDSNLTLHRLINELGEIKPAKFDGGFKSEVQPRYDASVASSRRLRGVF